MRIILMFAIAGALHAGDIEIRTSPAHLRSGAAREWLEFPAEPLGQALAVTFAAEPNDREYTLRVRQRDVKNPAWNVRMNGRTLGQLAADERDIVVQFAVPAGLLRAGGNTLEIGAAAGRTSDDIEVSDLRIARRPPGELLREATVRVDAGGTAPVRITVVDARGSLVPIASLGNAGREAVRTGVIYTLDGRAEFGAPAGTYQVFASRGWEYSAPSHTVKLQPGRAEQLVLRPRREVVLPGYRSCDTHVHTLELSGHGDATIRERLITAAGEGLDIIVATEHNRVSDYSAALRELGLERRLTVIPGSEVTTALGHFDVFPLSAEGGHPDWKAREWSALAESIGKAGASGIIVQNHPRDLHAGYRPFDAAHHLSPAGENLNGRPFFANAVEVVNSGAMQSDMLEPVRDCWAC
jgi:hypothetical protein